jgi:hypothetical protein
MAYRDGFLLPMNPFSIQLLLHGLPEQGQGERQNNAQNLAG